MKGDTSEITLKTPYMYVKIDGKNKLEEQDDDFMNQLLMDSVNAIAVDDIDEEMKKIFIKILPENKENDILKLNYSLASKIMKKSNLNGEQMKKKCDEYMDVIINRKIEPNSPLFLTREINEKLSFILMIIFKHIKKYGKFSDYEDLKKCVSKLSNSQYGLIDSLQIQNNSKSSSYMCINDDSFLEKSNLSLSNKQKSNDIPLDHNINIEPFRMSHLNPHNPNAIFNINNNMNKNKSQKIKIDRRIPPEFFMLRQKFENIQIVKLSLKSHNAINELILLDQDDIIYNIFILINLSLLFPNFIGIELDLSNELILKDEIQDINQKYEKVLKILKKNGKITCYKKDYKTRIYDIYKSKSIFSNSSSNKNTTSEDIESSDTFSSYIFINHDDLNKKGKEKFLSKHMYAMQMIIVYWYLFSMLKYIKVCNFIVPINFEDNILLMLREYKTFFPSFNFFGTLTGNLSEVTFDFNSLDNKLFLQVISFLFKNNQLTKCHLSLFPPEEYFEPRHLFFLLCQNLKTKITKNDIKAYEDIDVFILRKLYENFEININKLFIYYTNMMKLKDISLYLDIPSVIEKVSNYEMIIIKLIINLFIYINQPVYSSNSFTKLTIIADNLNFDNRKYMFLNDFFENFDIYQNKICQIESLTLKFKIYEITNFYRIIPYNITHLSLGSFDLISLQYFVEYITSSEFSVHSQIKFLQISLSNSLIILVNELYNALEKLLIEFPKNLEEISINTSLIANNEQIENLLQKTNYNKIQRIQISFNSNQNKIYKTPKKKLNIEENNENTMDLYYIKIDEIYEKYKNIILKMMYKLGNKFNKDFMDFNIYSQMEKFLCNKEKKTIIFQ